MTDVDTGNRPLLIVISFIRHVLLQQHYYLLFALLFSGEYDSYCLVVGQDGKVGR